MILIVVLAFLLPLAVYCLILAAINRRPHPVMVPGAWDFAGVLVAASGFLLAGGPFILVSLNQRWREHFLRGKPGRSLEALSQTNPYWLSLWIVYFVAIVGGALFWLRRRRNYTSIYNVEPAVFEQILGRALDRLKVHWSRAGRGFLLGPEAAEPPLSRPVKEEHITAEPPVENIPRADLVPHDMILEMDVFATVYHVTLRWPQDATPIRQAVERELAGDLAQVWTENNPTGLWLFSVAAGLISLMVLDVVFVLIVIFREVMS